MTGLSADIKRAYPMTNSSGIRSDLNSHVADVIRYAEPWIAADMSIER